MFNNELTLISVRKKIFFSYVKNFTLFFFYFSNVLIVDINIFLSWSIKLFIDIPFF
jgi:hypothetical protein